MSVCSERDYQNGSNKAVEAARFPKRSDDLLPLSLRFGGIVAIGELLSR